MFTVIAADQSHIDNINQKYALFLQPFLDEKKIAFCGWHTEKNRRTLTEAVPELEKTVGDRQDWRLIAVIPGEGADRLNPFDYVGWNSSIPRHPQTEKEWKDWLDGKKAQFKRAEENPLTRLVTFLCQSPFVVHYEEKKAAPEPELYEYSEKERLKEQARAEIVGEEHVNISEPREIICVALRSLKLDEHDIDTAWSRHDENDYSKFYDRNMYYAKMRYLIYDIPEDSERRFAFDYVRFLYILLVIAGNELPAGILKAERVYSLKCGNNIGAMRQLIQRYGYKLAVTQFGLESEIRRMKEEEPVRLSDEQREELVSARVDPVVFANAFDEVRLEELSVRGRIVGMASDDPRDEKGAFGGEYNRISESVRQFLKTPGRVLRAAAVRCRELGNGEVRGAEHLEKIDQEDLRETLGKEETAMVDCLPEGYDSSHFRDRMGEARKPVDAELDSRMSKKTTVSLGAGAVIVSALGYLIPLIQGAVSGRETAPGWIIAAAAAAALFIAALVCVHSLRRKTEETVENFNQAMRSLAWELTESFHRYSGYLTHAAAFMVGSKALSTAEKQENPNRKAIIVRTKHIRDIIRRREEIREVFGPFMPEEFLHAKPAINEDSYVPAEGYQYNFDIGTEYVYPIPFERRRMERTALYTRGNTVNVPVALTNSIEAVREEIYDE